MNRRTFLQLSAAAAGAGAVASSCKNPKTIRGKIIGSSHQAGHLLRDGKFGEPAVITKHKVVIIGGGVSGLSAARFLHKSGIDDFVVLDLEEKMGGNAAQGENAVSRYSWGAHYIPIPNNNLHEYIHFLQECNVITAIHENGLPEYNEDYLCFDPQERLYINGRWQQGLIPHFGVPDADSRQIEAFFRLMDHYRHLTGTDGREAFAIPVDASSRDTELTHLDTLTMKQWLLDQSFSSHYLHWYVDYCTRDDYGTSYDQVSAWSGIHYHASRKGKGVNAAHQDVLTWPEGNGWLVQQLQSGVYANMHPGCVTVRVQQTRDGVRVVYYDLKDHKLKSIEALQCIAAVPQFSAARLLEDEDRITTVRNRIAYAPWMVANITVPVLQERSGAPMSWDNVIYGSNSLGYVEATHELQRQHIARRNLTYYLPLTGLPPAEQRRMAMQTTHAQWADLIIADLKKVHPDIEEKVEEINVMIWGHAMAQPLPGMVFGGLRNQLGASLDGKIHFAHTDLAGISIFEEAFYQGLQAAKKVVHALG